MLGEPDGRRPETPEEAEGGGRKAKTQGRGRRDRKATGTGEPRKGKPGAQTRAPAATTPQGGVVVRDPTLLDKAGVEPAP